MGSFPEMYNEFSMVYSFIAIVKLLFIGNCCKQPFLGILLLKVTISLPLNLKKGVSFAISLCLFPLQVVLILYTEKQPRLSSSPFGIKSNLGPSRAW